MSEVPKYLLLVWPSRYCTVNRFRYLNLPDSCEPQREKSGEPEQDECEGRQAGPRRQPVAAVSYSVRPKENKHRYCSARTRSHFDARLLLTSSPWPLSPGLEDAHLPAAGSAHQIAAEAPRRTRRLLRVHEERKWISLHSHPPPSYGYY